MKTIPLHLEDDQYEKLLNKKGEKTWIEFIMQLAE